MDTFNDRCSECGKDPESDFFRSAVVVRVLQGCAGFGSEILFHSLKIIRRMAKWFFLWFFFDVDMQHHHARPR